MKSRLSIVALALMSLPLFAHASCDAVKSDIDAKIKASGVSSFSLNVVDADQADKSEGKVVGHCEGSKAIVYSRGSSAASDGNTSNAAPVPPPETGRSSQTGG